MSDKHTRRLRTWILGAVTVLFFGIANGAGILSYSALYRLAEETNMPDSWYWIWPLTIDAWLFAGALYMLYDEVTGVRGRGRTPGIAVLVAGTCFSTWVQVLMTPDPTGLARMVHASPPVVVALAWWSFMSVLRREIASVSASGSDTAGASGISLTDPVEGEVLEDSVESPHSGDDRESVIAEGRTPLRGVLTEEEGPNLTLDNAQPSVNARLADPAKPISAAPAARRTTGVARGDTQGSPALDLARAIVEAWDGPERLTGKALAQRMTAQGRRVSAGRGRQLLIELRNEVKQDANALS